jgi:phage shock protein C
MGKELLRSIENKMIAGVCGGIGEYFSVDPTIIRIIWAAVTLAFLPGGVAAYIVAIIVMPERKNDNFRTDCSTDSRTDCKDMPENTEKITGQAGFDSQRTRIVMGSILICFGALFFLKEFFYFDVRYMWPIIFIAAGIYIILRGGRRNNEE